MSEKKDKIFHGVKPIFAYFKDSFRFHHMDNPIIPQTVFVVILAIIFSGNLIARPYVQSFQIYYEQFAVQFSELNLETVDIAVVYSMFETELFKQLINTIIIAGGILLIIKILSYFVALFYGSYYFYSLTRPETTLSQRINMFLQRLPKIIGFNALFYFILVFAFITFILLLALIGMVLPALVVLIAPAIPILIIIIDLVFIFKNLLIIEFDPAILQNFKKSFDIVKKFTGRIVSNGLFPHILALMLTAIAADINNQLLSLFIVAFFEVIILLFAQRLIVLMFIDLTSLKSDKADVKEVTHTN